MQDDVGKGSAIIPAAPHASAPDHAERGCQVRRLSSGLQLSQDGLRGLAKQQGIHARDQQRVAARQVWLEGGSRDPEDANTASDPLQFPDEGPPWQPSRLFYTAMLRSFFQKMRETLQAAGVDTSDFDRPEMQRLGYEDADVTTTIDVSDYTDAKQAGFSAHRTQFAADGPFSRLDAETQRAMFAYEHYILARPVDAEPVAADDLFG
jgi:hypothetical protein